MYISTCDHHHLSSSQQHSRVLNRLIYKTFQALRVMVAVSIHPLRGSSAAITDGRSPAEQGLLGRVPGGRIDSAVPASTSAQRSTRIVYQSFGANAFLPVGDFAEVFPLVVSQWNISKVCRGRNWSMSGRFF